MSAKRPRMALHSIRLMSEIHSYIRQYDIRGDALPAAASDVLDGAVFNREISDLIRRRYLTVVSYDGELDFQDHCGGSWTVYLTDRSIRLFWPSRVLPTTAPTVLANASPEATKRADRDTKED